MFVGGTYTKVGFGSQGYFAMPFKVRRRFSGILAAPEYVDIGLGLP